MQRYRTKNPVLIEPIKMVTDTVYIAPEMVNFDGFVYSVNVVYTTKNPVNDEYVVLSEYPINFTTAEADELEVALSVVGNTISERLNDLLNKGTLYLLGENGVFGLTSADYEEYND